MNINLKNCPKKGEKQIVSGMKRAAELLEARSFRHRF